MENVTHDTLPAAIEVVLQRLEWLTEKVSNLESGKTTGEWLSIEDLCEYLPGKPKKKTIYAKIDEIPHSKNGKRLVFKKSQIDEWLLEGGWES